jgi:hypothetical protein
VDIEPGSDDDITDDEDLEDLQGNFETPPPADPPDQESIEILSHISEQFKNVSISQVSRDAQGTMKGFFIQEDIQDPDDPLVKRRRMCCFYLLPSGMNVNNVEVTRAGRVVTLNGRLAPETARADILLGDIGALDPSMVKGLQEEIDKQLRVENRNGSFTSLSWEGAVMLPGNVEIEKDFVNPRTNRIARDPVCFNRIPSTDPEVQSDTILCACFILARKDHEGGTPARGSRDRRSTMKANLQGLGRQSSFSPGGRTPPPPPPHYPPHHQGQHQGRHGKRQQSTSFSPHVNYYSESEDDEESSDNEENEMEWSHHGSRNSHNSRSSRRTSGPPVREARIPSSTRTGTGTTSARRHPSTTARTSRGAGSTSSSLPELAYPSSSINSVSEYQSAAGSVGARTSTSGSKRNRGSRRGHSSPRRRQQLNDRSIVEDLTEEIQETYDNDIPGLGDFDDSAYPPAGTGRVSEDVSSDEPE